MKRKLWLVLMILALSGGTIGTASAALFWGGPADAGTNVGGGSYWFDYTYRNNAFTNISKIYWNNNCTTNPAVGPKCLHINYKMQSIGGNYGGYGMGYQISPTQPTGVQISNSIKNGENLTFMAKAGASGTSASVKITSQIGESQGFSINTLVTTTWSKVVVPLASLTNSSFRLSSLSSSNSVFHRFKLEFGNNGVFQDLYIDDIKIEGVVDSTPPAAPTLASPADLSIQTNNFTVATSENVNFVWHPASDASGIADYTIQISLNKNFTTIYTQRTILTTNVTITLPKHTYYWRVGTRDNQANQSAWSTSRQVNVLVVPLDMSIENVVTSTKVTLTVPAYSLSNSVTYVIITELPGSGVKTKGTKTTTPDFYFTVELQNLMTIKMSNMPLKDLSYPAKLQITTPTAENYELYFFDGVKWIKAGSSWDGASTVTFNNVNILGGEFALFKEDAAVAAKMVDVTAGGNFTPNGDGINDLCIFSFDNPNSAKAAIKIFSLKGRLVKEIKSAVSGSAWDGKDTEGKNAASGPYIYQLTVGTKVFSGSIILKR